MEKKYRLDENDTIEIEGRTLHRIIALKNSKIYPYFQEGDKGGYIESENNLSHEGDCWVGDNSCVFGSSEVKHAGYVHGNSIIKDTVIKNTSRVYNTFMEDSCLEGMCSLGGGDILDSVLTDTDIYDNAKIIESELNGSIVSDTVTLKRATITYCELQGSLIVNNTTLKEIDLKGDAVINSERDFIVFKNNFSSNRTFVWTRSNDKWNVGCFYGTGKELIEKAYKDGHIKGKYYEAYVNFIENIKKINDERTREFEQSTKDISLG